MTDRLGGPRDTIPTAEQPREAAIKFYRIGIDANGQSAMVESRNADPQPLSPELSVSILADFVADDPQPEVLRRQRDAHFMDLGVPAGHGRWVAFSYPPNSRSAMHHTSTHDMQVVVAGEVTIGTQTNAVTLGVGDCVMIPGLEHVWSTGAVGCTLVGVVLGLAAT